MICTLCPRRCAAERTGETGRGVCGAGTMPRIARAALHRWEEPCISGRHGSGAVFFSGCPLRCRYCQNEEISRGRAGEVVSCERLAEIFRELEDQGAENINLVTAGHFVPAVIRALSIYRPRVPVVYNTSGYESLETLRSLEGLVDIYLPDLKYLDERTAAWLSGAADYPRVAVAAIHEMIRQTGPAMLNEEDMMVSGTLIRHLVLPGMVTRSLQVLTFIRDEFPGVPVSVMGQYIPCGEAAGIPGLDRKLTGKEYARVIRHAEQIGLEGFRQMAGADSRCYVPAFDGTGVKEKSR